MARKFTLVKVKCLAPSKGLGGAVEWVAVGVGAAVGAAGSLAATTASGGALVATVGVATVGGASAGQWAATSTDRVFKGRDDLYIKINGQKIWPGGKYEHISSQEEKTINYTTDFNGDIKIELWEHDSWSSDDGIGYLVVPASWPNNGYIYRIESKDEKSAYEVAFILSDA